MMIEPSDKDRDLAERREKIEFMINHGATIKDLVAQLGVSRATIERDIQWLSEHAVEWLNRRAITGFAYKFKQTLQKFEALERDLHIMKQRLDNETRDLEKEGKSESVAHFDKRLKLNRAILENLVVQAQFDAEVPTLQSMNKIVAEMGGKKDDEIV